MTKTKKPGTVEAWDSGELGEDLNSAQIVSEERTAQIQEAAELQMISIRLPKSVIEDFKVIAQIEGVGYQPLMRIALMRYAECEAKRVMREYAANLRGKSPVKVIEQGVTTKVSHRREHHMDKKAA